MRIENNLDLLRWAIVEHGDTSMYIEFKDNIVENMWTSDGNSKMWIVVSEDEARKAFCGNVFHTPVLFRNEERKR